MTSVVLIRIFFSSSSFVEFFSISLSLSGMLNVKNDDFDEEDDDDEEGGGVKALSTTTTDVLELFLSLLFKI